MPKYKPAPDQQPELIAEPRAEYTVTPQQQAEKDAYRERLRLHLKDPVFRKIEGFPIAEDEAILALSDPPYYTACPNPFLGEIIEKWQQERTALRQELGLPVDSPILQAGEGEGVMAEPYHREPFAADVSEGKNDPIYNAHSYHTKVPHKAIMRYILHYTDPGDIILDGFCGTGMTGVAAQLCGDKATVENLGYHVDRKGLIYDSPPEKGGSPIARLGVRKAVLVDLSPAATFIAYNYNTPVDARAFEREARRILAEVERECGWMYETLQYSDETQARLETQKINYMVWSEVFTCPNCGAEMSFWDVAVDHQTGYRKDKEEPLSCASCGQSTPLGNLERTVITEFDRNLGETSQKKKIVPVLINFSRGKVKAEVAPQPGDYAVLQRVDSMDIPYWYPTTPMMFKGYAWGDTWRAGVHLGFTHVHHFYTRRNLWSWAYLYYLANKSDERIRRKILFWLQSVLLGQTLLNRYLSASYSQVNRYMKGTLYVAPFISETNPRLGLSGKIKAVGAANIGQRGEIAIATGSSTSLEFINTSSVDYVFVDPPFGSNIMYSDLNFIWEAWLKIVTNNNPEAIVNEAQKKILDDFRQLVQRCFTEFFRVLKSGRWMTVEFHNSQNSVWNAIQESIINAGFVIADVRTLDKQQITMQQMISTGAVKQDLIISAYKPDSDFERRFKIEGGSIQGAWDFTRQHLEQLPVPVIEDGVIETLAERQGYLLYDRMVAFHIQRGLSVPLSAPEFYAGLLQRFLDRDGMYFTPAQAAEYDRRRLGAQKVEQLSLFVSDEKSALLWLRRELNPETGGGPQTYQDLQPKFIRELHQARHEALPELRTILEQNFLQDPAGRWYVPNPERQADLDELRQKALLREYGEYMQGKGRLKVFRSEAVRAGFSHAWKERDYAAILKVAERLPETVLQEDQNLLMYLHNAALRQQEQPRQMPLI